jgi:putative SOS response-associated peptidase YedK
MCGRYTLTRKALQLAHRPTLQPADETVRLETWNLAPSTLVVGANHTPPAGNLVDGRT